MEAGAPVGLELVLESENGNKGGKSGGVFKKLTSLSLTLTVSCRIRPDFDDSGFFCFFFLHACICCVSANSESGVRGGR